MYIKHSQPSDHARFHWYIYREGAENGTNFWASEFILGRLPKPKIQNQKKNLKPEKTQNFELLIKSKNQSF